MMIYNDLIDEITEKNILLDYNKLFMQFWGFFSESLVSSVDNGNNKRKYLVA